MFEWTSDYDERSKQETYEVINLDNDDSFVTIGIIPYPSIGIEKTIYISLHKDDRQFDLTLTLNDKTIDELKQIAENEYNRFLSI